MLDFNVIKLFDINTRTGKVLCPLPIRREFPSPSWVKINTDKAARGYPGLATCGGISRGSLLVLSLHFLKFRQLWLLSFMELYMLWRKLKRWGLNIWLEYDFALVCVAFTARTNVSWMLRNRWNTCLNYCGEIRFRVTHIFREGNACVDKLTNLGFIHRESFHWYNRFPSSPFSEFFMNRYSLPISFLLTYGFWSSPPLFFFVFSLFYSF